MIDFGPSVTLDHGIAVSSGAGVVDLEFRADPDTPKGALVRGARRRNVVGTLYARGSITKRHHDAVERFLDDCSLASGGGLVANLMNAGRSSPLPRAGLPEVQVAAAGRVREVVALLGLLRGSVMWWVVFECRGPGERDAQLRVREGTSSGLFREACEMLDSHYG